MTTWDDDAPLSPDEERAAERLVSGAWVGQGRSAEDVRHAGRVVQACLGLAVLVGLAKVGVELVLWIWQACLGH